MLIDGQNVSNSMKESFMLRCNYINNLPNSIPQIKNPQIVNLMIEDQKERVKMHKILYFVNEINERVREMRRITVRSLSALPQCMFDAKTFKYIIVRKRIIQCD